MAENKEKLKKGSLFFETRQSSEGTCIFLMFFISVFFKR